MIGATVPRKARSGESQLPQKAIVESNSLALGFLIVDFSSSSAASVKRPHESAVEEQSLQTEAASPSSSNVSLRKKMV